MWHTTNETEMANVIITDRVRKAARRRLAKQASRRRD
jgi:hypothetical protein